jgi:mycofactocin precursor
MDPGGRRAGSGQSQAPDVENGVSTNNQYHRCMDTETVDETAAPGDEAVIEEELLIEEISIDGMCGVY